MFNKLKLSIGQDDVRDVGYWQRMAAGAACIDRYLNSRRSCMVIWRRFGDASPVYAGYRPSRGSETNPAIPANTTEVMRFMCASSWRGLHHKLV